jgi:AraC-like DNA-binding protein
MSEMASPKEVGDVIDLLQEDGWVIETIAAALDYKESTLKLIRRGTNRGMPRDRFRQLEALIGVNVADANVPAEKLPKRGRYVDDGRWLKARNILEDLLRRYTRKALAEALGLSRNGFKKVLRSPRMTPYRYRTIIELEKGLTPITRPAPQEHREVELMGFDDSSTFEVVGQLARELEYAIEAGLHATTPGFMAKELRDVRRDVETVRIWLEAQSQRVALQRL